MVNLSISGMSLALSGSQYLPQTNLIK